MNQFLENQIDFEVSRIKVAGGFMVSVKLGNEVSHWMVAWSKWVKRN